jgi:uncharacterized protein YxeA
MKNILFVLLAVLVLLSGCATMEASIEIDENGEYYLDQDTYEALDAKEASPAEIFGTLITTGAIFYVWGVILSN